MAASEAPTGTPGGVTKRKELRMKRKTVGRSNERCMRPEVCRGAALLSRAFVPYGAASLEMGPPTGLRDVVEEGGVLGQQGELTGVNS